MAEGSILLSEDSSSCEVLMTVVINVIGKLAAAMM
jgi:hypothetical protein